MKEIIYLHQCLQVLIWGSDNISAISLETIAVCFI